MYSGIYGNREKEEQAIKKVFEELYGNSSEALNSVIAAWYGEDTERDGQILAGAGIRVLAIGEVLYERGFFDT